MKGRAAHTDRVDWLWADISLSGSGVQFQGPGPITSTLTLCGFTNCYASGASADHPPSHAPVQTFRCSECEQLDLQDWSTDTLLFVSTVYQLLLWLILTYKTFAAAVTLVLSCGTSCFYRISAHHILLLSTWLQAAFFGNSGINYSALDPSVS